MAIEGIHYPQSEVIEGSITRDTGDFADRQLSEVLAIINNTARKSFENYKNDPNESHVAQKGRELRAHISMARDYVSKDSHYAKESSSIPVKYIAAEILNKGKNLSMEERVANRLKQFENFNVISDFDGTITEDPTLYLNHIPGSEIAEPALAASNRTNFPEVFAGTWQGILKDAPSLFESVGEHITFRRGIKTFLQYLRRGGNDFTILSANFFPVITAALPKITEDRTRIYAITPDDITSTEKDIIIRHEAKNNPEKAIIYIGDGSSDLPAIEAKDYVACYFALEGSSFAKELAKNNLPHFTYKDFNDIQLKLAQLKKLVAS